MTKRKLLNAMLLLGLVVLVGCKEPEAAKEIGTKNAEAGKKTASKEPSSKELKVGPEVGMLAPEISGEDLDGVAFKLSDYRGKVVMLDFYGDW